MKYLIIVGFVLCFIKSSGQLNHSDIKEFSERVNYRMRINSTTAAVVSEEMISIYPSHSPLQVKADIEQLGTDPELFDRFCYGIVLNQNGNRESSSIIFNAMCDNATLSYRITDYIKEKYKNKLADGIATNKLKAEKDQKIENEKNIQELKNKNIIAQNEEKERIAKEKSEKENIPPNFNGNWSSFYAKNFRYPSVSEFPTGQIEAKFIVKADGTVDSVFILNNTLMTDTNTKNGSTKGPCPSDVKLLFENEVARFLRLTKWTTGLKNNQPSDYELSQKFTFTDNQ